MDPIPPTIEWRRGRVRLIDQRALPGELRFVECATVDELCDAITSLAVRGAPALGAAGAFGVALAAHTTADEPGVRAAARRLASARPTASNLAWGVDARAGRVGGGRRRCRPRGGGARRGRRRRRQPRARRVRSRARPRRRARAHALQRGIARDRRLRHRARRRARRARRGQATDGVGRGDAARAPGRAPDRMGARPARHPGHGHRRRDVRLAHGDRRRGPRGRRRRPHRRQRRRRQQDRHLSVGGARREHGVPFIVAAPTSTIDLATPAGAAIPVEERPEDEVVRIAGERIAPDGVARREPRLRRDARPARDRDRHRARRPSPSVRGRAAHAPRRRRCRTPPIRSVREPVACAGRGGVPGVVPGMRPTGGAGVRRLRTDAPRTAGAPATGGCRPLARAVRVRGRGA